MMCGVYFKGIKQKVRTDTGALLDLLKNEGYVITEIESIQGNRFKRVSCHEAKTKLHSEEWFIEFNKKYPGSKNISYGFNLYILKKKIYLTFADSYLLFIDEDSRAYQPYLEIIELLQNFLRPLKITKNFAFHDEMDINGNIIDWDKKFIKNFNLEWEHEE